MIRNQGSPEQRAWLADYLQSLKTPADLAADSRKEQYGASLNQERDPASPDDRLTAAGGRLYSTMMKGRGTSHATLPPAELYRASRSLLWTAYKIQVLNETGRSPVVPRGGQLANALAQVAHWLVGLNEWHGDPGTKCIPTNKSLYLVGGVGTGKSTLAIAAHYASMQLASEYKSGMRFALTSMDQLITQVYTGSTLEPVQEIAKGNVVLDELRLKHIGYKHFGNDVTLVADILLNRHHLWKQEGRQTIITTNVPTSTGNPNRPGLVEALADERISDRLFQQYHTMLLTGESFRKL